MERLRAALLPGFELVVEGRQKVSYGSTKERTAWIDSAELFVRAAAVLGPHGGAFGNIYLCSWNTTIIEFNVPWTTRTADGDSRVNEVRDLFYSTARGIGNFNFWAVWPKDRFRRPSDFYQSGNMHIDVDEVIHILRLAKIAA